MSSNPNRLPCCDPFQAFTKGTDPNSPSSPTSPSDRLTHGPTQPETISQQPASTIAMNLVRVPSNLQPVSKSVTGQSGGWGGFATVLEKLVTEVGIFPPLQKPLSDLLACTVHIQIAEQNRQEYDQLASDLVELVQTLQAHLPGSKPGRMPYSIGNVARSIGEQAAHIKRQQDRLGLNQAIRASDDEVDIVGCYRKIGHIFRQLQTDISLSIWDLTRDLRMDAHLKDLNPADYARYDAALSMDDQGHQGMEGPRDPLMERQRGGCTPNTRVDILKQAIGWTRNLDGEKIYWMNGMAGTGKTTIAYSLCEQLEESRQLGACFFCSRNFKECRDVNKIVPTIAYHLAQFSNPYKNELCEVLTSSQDPAKRQISKQFKTLIVDPLSKVKGAIPSDVVVVIDALDECTDVGGTRLILELLSEHAAALPIKFFVTSRPEPGISSVLSARDPSRLVFRLHNVAESLVQEDIHTYLKYELRNIKIEPADVERLAVRAGRLFIFAATAVRYIQPNDITVEHEERLAIVLGTRAEAEGQSYQELDELYTAIISRALSGAKGDEREGRLLVLRTVIGAKEPLDTPTLTELTGSRSEQSVQRTLLLLQSVLMVSADTKVISPLHASFPDFMLNADRSKGFYCDMTKQNTYMMTRCFEIMKGSLKFNICELETSSQRDQDVPDFQARVKDTISSGLFYACRYWGDHMCGASYSKRLINTLDEFLQYRLLYWMEVLNLKDCIGSAAAILLQAFKFLPSDDTMNELRTMIQDSRNFATTYAASPASRSTPHIYISALPLVPTKSFIWKILYRSQMRGLARFEGTAVKDRGDAALATWSVGPGVSKLLLSKDGSRLASGSFGGTITVWDVRSGRRILGPLEKHQVVVYALAFSPDGTRIASGSFDSRIYVWNSSTGDTLPGAFEGHTKSITGLLFSLDGARLISCCEDYTIRIWDSFTGFQIGLELKGHQDCVMSIALSSNGRLLISGSDDHTIRVWDLSTGTTIIGPIQGHTDWVDCIALSPDDKRIASSSRDRTVRQWSTEDGKPTMNPLLGHTDRVWSVAYSPDGTKIVSAGYDKTIRVWSSETGDLVAGPFRGHEDTVFSALFSSDGTHIISGSHDGTICIWDASHSISGSDSHVAGHTGAILSIALSPDGTRVVSGSQDHTICVWDIHSGDLILGPLIGHTDIVWSVAYTPDGTTIVSVSEDCTIRTWDAHTGLALATPFAQHPDSVGEVRVSPDSRLVVSGSRDMSIKIWDLRTGLEVANPTVQHTNPVFSVDFSPNGLFIASGSFDHSVCLWNAETGSLIRKLEQHTDWVTSARFSPDSTKLVTGSKDETLIVWDVDTGAVVSGPWKGHDDEIRGVAFSPDGAMIASGSNDGTIRLWDTNTGTTLAVPFTGHTGPVYSVAFTPDGKHIVSGSGDPTIRVWDLGVGDHLQQEADGGEAGDGWIKDSESRLMLWLPPDLKRIIPVPPCSLIISPKGSVRANFKDMIYGDRWMDCYVPPSDSDTTDV